MPGAGLMLLDIFLLEAELLGRGNTNALMQISSRRKVAECDNCGIAHRQGLTHAPGSIL